MRYYDILLANQKRTDEKFIKLFNFLALIRKKNYQRSHLKEKKSYTDLIIFFPQKQFPFFASSPFNHMSKAPKQSTQTKTPPDTNKKPIINLNWRWVPYEKSFWKFVCITIWASSYIYFAIFLSGQEKKILTVAKKKKFKKKKKHQI